MLDFEVLRAHSGWSFTVDGPRLAGGRARAVVGVVLGAIGVLLFFAILSGAPDAFRSAGDSSDAETWVYRIDTRDLDGNWTVYEWGVAGGPRRAGVVQTEKRTCQRQSDSHRCRSTVEATFTDSDSAHDHRRTLCQNYRQDLNRLPDGMTSC